MTQALEKALAEVAKLPKAEQDRIAQWLLDELASEREWERLFAGSQDKLSKLADEALEDVRAGRATELKLSDL